MARWKNQFSFLGEKKGDDGMKKSDARRARNDAIYSTSSELLSPGDGEAAKQPSSTVGSITIDQVQLEACLVGQGWFVSTALQTCIHYLSTDPNFEKLLGFQFIGALMSRLDIMPR